MKKRPTIAAAFAFATLSLSNDAIASDLGTAPEAGTYQALLYVQSATAGCIDKAGFAFTGSMSFGGLSASKDYLRALETGNNFAVDSIQTLTVTGGKGTTQLSGSFVWTGSGIGGGWTENGTFSAMVTEIGTHAFILQLKETYSGCTAEDINVSLVRIGANQ